MIFLVASRHFCLAAAMPPEAVDDEDDEDEEPLEPHALSAVAAITSATRTTARRR